MRILVTGANGFLGTHVLAEARRKGWMVDAVVRPGGAVPDVAGRVLHADLADGTAIAGIDPSDCQAVIHLAGRVDRGMDVAACRAALSGIIGTTLPLLEHLLARGFAGRVVVATSAAKYGLAAAPFGEAAPCRPVDAYGFAKAELSALLAFFAARVPLRLVEAIPFNCIGRGQPARLVPAAFAARIAALPPSGGTIAVGSTAAVRDFVAAEDVACALLLLAAEGVPGAAYNIATGAGVAVSEVLARLRALAAVPFDWCGPDATADHEPVDASVGDASRLRALGWQPAVPLDDSLTATLREAGVALVVRSKRIEPPSLLV